MLPFSRPEKHAREIVPSFSATVYFTVASTIARFLSETLYRVRIGRFDAVLSGLDPKATVVFVMNHRSNMDYVLVTYLAAQRSALSYAVGEWARIWPISLLIRAMGAFFIRRKSRGLLYRRVLARYVQMATQGGVTQAVFPEGGLSLDGRIAPPRLGILNYVISGLGTKGPRCNIRARIDQLRSGPGGLHSSRCWQARPEAVWCKYFRDCSIYWQTILAMVDGPLSALWLCGCPFWHAG
jgi:glycerol-3-phosphate O-acyltransferase